MSQASSLARIGTKAVGCMWCRDTAVTDIDAWVSAADRLPPAEDRLWFTLLDVTVHPGFSLRAEFKRAAMSIEHSAEVDLGVPVFRGPQR